MNEYLKQYIELQKQFRETEGNPDSVRALYTFKLSLIHIWKCSLSPAGPPASTVAMWTSSPGTSERR